MLKTLISLALLATVTLFVMGVAVEYSDARNRYHVFTHKTHKVKVRREQVKEVDSYQYEELYQNYPQNYPQTRNKVKASSGFSISGGLAGRAYHYIGRTARELGVPLSLWCSDFMNLLTNHQYNTDRSAKSWAHVGTPASPGCIDCVAILKRKGGSHVGVVTGWKNGNPVIISGNHGRTVGVSEYPIGRVYALRNP